MFSATEYTPLAFGIRLVFIFILNLAPAVATAQPTDNKPKQTTQVNLNAPTKISAEDSCTKLFQRYVSPLQELWKKRATDLKSENTDGYSMIEDLTSDHCKEAESRSDLIGLLARVLNTHSGKIAIILPTSKLNYLQHVISGIEAHAQSIGLDPKKTFLILDSEDKDEKILQNLASAVFEHKVSAIIGGSEPKEAQTLQIWASRLLIPTFILSEPNTLQPHPFVFYAHPTQKGLAQGAIEANIRFGHKRVSILTPADQHSDRFVNAYVEGTKNAGITVLHQVSYDPKRFDNMEAAAKKLFRLDGSDRKEELKKLYETAKKHAKETGTKFNPKMVALQPDVQQDAILIPDTFRVVRHFAKIFVFLGVRRIATFGHFEWRSVGIISPWDSFLNNSYFVDFQGLYSGMPEAIRIKNLESPYFVPNDKIDLADFSMLGWRAAQTPLLLIQKKSEPRRKLDKMIPRKATGPNDVVYDQNNTMTWTPNLFKISGSGKTGNISLVNP